MLQSRLHGKNWGFLLCGVYTFYAIIALSCFLFQVRLFLEDSELRNKAGLCDRTPPIGGQDHASHAGHPCAHIHQCCGSGKSIPDPGSWFLSIPDPASLISDPGSKNSNIWDGWKKFVVLPFFADTNITKFKVFYFWTCVEKNLGQFTKNYKTF